MARWDRILYNGRQYVPADKYDEVRETLDRLIKAVGEIPPGFLSDEDNDRLLDSIAPRAEITE